jgi:phage/plasmid-like protein (TIGR03299 family)
MSHLIDQTAGMNAIAYVGDTPWHGLGQTMQPNEPLEAWRQRAGLGWEAIMTPALFQTDQDVATIPDQSVLYRSDTRAALSVVSNRYKIVQPEEIVEFYRDLTESHGFKMETLGAIKSGRVIWALARTGDVAKVDNGIDRVDGFLLLSTSFDGSMATTGRFTTVRVVCNNTLTMAHHDDKPAVSIPHSRLFDVQAAKIKLGVGDAFTTFMEEAKRMANAPVTTKQAIEYFLAVFHDMTSAEVVEKQAVKATDRTIARLSQHFIAGPGSELATAKSTVWGLLNAVTHDVDYNARSRTGDSRLASAWYGDGARLKEKARELALELAPA